MGQDENDAPGLTELGRAIRRAREQSKMSAGELATACGVPVASIDALEQGKLDPTYDLLFTVAHTLHTRPSALIALAERPC